MTDQEKLDQLCELEATSEEQLLSDATLGDDCMGICMNEDCECVQECEPDASNNWCEECETMTVKSCLMLKGVI